MGLFSRKKPLAETTVFEGMKDAHCHILPGVDDGVQKLEESLAILATFEKLGIREVTLTPHIMEDCPNETSFLRDEFEKFKAAYNGPVKLRLAAEHMLDNLFIKRLEADDLLLWDEGLLLVETSYYNPPYAFQDIISKILAKGIRPILAHPERYEYMTMEDYDRLYLQGVRLQLNVLSLTGAYGMGAKMKAEALLKKGYYSYRGTDIHSHRSFLFHTEKDKVAKDIIELLNVK